MTTTTPEAPKVNPQPVMVGEEHVGFACPACKMMYTALNAKELAADESSYVWSAARDHCVHTCSICGADLGKSHWTKCQPCIDKEQKDQELAKFAGATYITADKYEGFVHVPDSESFYDSYDTFLQEWDDLPPDYLWACTPTPFKLDAESIVDNELQNHYEDAGESIGHDEYAVLQGLLDEWAKRQNIITYEPDFTRAILVPNRCAGKGCTCVLTTDEIMDKITLCEDCQPDAVA
jgi:hypothetical protein